MKIVYISSSFIPSRAANSIHVMKMCQAFARKGHDVTLLAPDTPDAYEQGVEDVYAFYDVQPCFETVKLPMPKVRGGGYLYSVAAALRARWLAPDIVYCRNIAGCYFALLAGMKAILEIHAPVAENGRLQDWMFRTILKSKRLVKLVAITDALKSHMRRHYPAYTGIVQVAPDGADEISSTVKPVSLERVEGHLHVGYVGHLYSGKGMEVVMPLARLCPWASFHVVGGTDDDIRKWQTAAESGSNLCFHGHCPPDEVASYTLAFDVLLLPNQERVSPSGGGRADIGKWTSPLKLFEYMSAGKAVIASDLPVLREVLSHEVNALLCPPLDIEAWSEALVRMRDDDALRERLGRMGRAMFLELYTWSTRAEALVGPVSGMAHHAKD